MSRLRAVVFDLFGTLVPEFAVVDWDRHFARMAEALGLEPGAFRREWEVTAIERQTGRLGDIRGTIVAICERLGRTPSSEQLEGAVGARMELYEKYFHPRSGAEETLRRLRDRGYPTALVSMCAPDTPALWRASRLGGLVDAEVFSCEVGLRKPEPDIYLLACERLEVEPDVCLYVGDGSYRELTGAAAVGMHAVLIRDLDEAAGSVLRPEAEAWDGRSVTALAEVPALLSR